MEPDGLTGRRIAAGRSEAHLSQRALAAELHVSVRTVQNYEAGRFVPYRHIDALSRVFGRSPAWLLYGHEQPEVGELLAQSRRQRDVLKKNLQQLRELRHELADQAGRAEAMLPTREG